MPASPGNLGAGSTIELKSHNGVAHLYGRGREPPTATGSCGVAQRRRISHINSSGSGALATVRQHHQGCHGAGQYTAPGRHFRQATADIEGDGIAQSDANIVSGVISETSGTLSMWSDSAATWRLTGANTYGGTTLDQRRKRAGSGRSGQWRPSLPASATVPATPPIWCSRTATLRYIGSGNSTDRLMTDRRFHRH